jgi:CHAT domain-containing protein
MKYWLLTFFSMVSFVSTIFSQKNDVVADVDSLITAEKYKEANQLIKERITLFFDTKNVDTLGDYINYLGKTTSKLKGLPVAQNEVLAVVQKAKTAFPYHKALVAVYLEAAYFLGNQGNNEMAYRLTLELDNYFLQKRNIIHADLSAIQSNMGDYTMRIGKFKEASKHYLQSIEFLKSNPKPDAQKMYFANNSLGIVMWYSSKLDSAVIYFNKAIDALNTMEATPLNRHFRPALVQNNIASCYNAQGKAREAISTFEKVIDNYKKFIASPEPNGKKENARIAQFQSVDNLAKVYLELGDFTKAHDLLYYSYQQKLNNFGEKSPEVYRSLIFLGTIYNNQKNYIKAQTFLNNAISRIREQGDVNNSWAGEAYGQLAVASEGLKNNTAAAAHYKEASRIYEAVYAGQYDDTYLSYLGNISLFYANNDEPALAISSVNKGLNYVTKVQGENSIGTALQLRNLAEVNYRLKKYKETISAATKGLTVLDNIILQSSEVIDSIKIEMEKPRLILLQSKARYELLPEKDIQSISLLLSELNKADDILDRRKTILLGEKDINALIAGNKELQEFIEKLNYELYKLSGNSGYLDKMIGSHEQNMYARIRSRMDKQNAIQFSGVPASLIQQETTLKAALQSSLKGSGTHDQKIGAYLTAVNNWNGYQTLLQNKYPAYYNMRYAGNEKSLSDLSMNIPADVTVLRYVFTGEDLFVLVASNKKQKLVALQNNNLKDQIISLNDVTAGEAKISETSFALYKQLWQPIEKEISNSRIMIIPDGILYNLSFEMLSATRPVNFADLKDKCLLNKYAISYHYSLLALSPSKKAGEMKNNFIGFSPEFSDKQKKEYSALIKTDSLHLDNGYLSLLPLPFTTSLVKRIHNSLGGEVFLHNESTPLAFRSEAANHTIIFIGTHAESNNNYPEFSRLIFAKDPQKANVENSLYLFDIYNCDLTSDLSVLTACESGKPGYQDGEGMISMAHAFNYAGSKSILTGLWKIDEQASIIITDIFYKNLQRGLTKDEALRQAKLSYLETTAGRMLAPQYWAGLVIMGDVSPVVFKNEFSVNWYLIATGALCAVLILFLLYKRKYK